MTINSTTRQAGPFSGDGVTTVFPFAFKVFQGSDLLVSTTNATLTQATLVLGTNYGVTLNADQNASPGGVVTLTSPLAIGLTMIIGSAVSTLQPLSLANGGPFLARSVEDALDRLTVLQQQVLSNYGQALRVPEVGTLPMIASASARANQLQGYDSAGNPIVVAPASGSAAALAGDLASTSINTKNAGQVGYNPALAYAAGTAGSRLRRLVYATDVGVNALGNYDPIGLTGADDTVALQAGLDLAGSRSVPPTITIGLHGLSLANAQQGTFVLAPGRHYKITGQLKVPPGVTFDLNGSVLWQTGTGDAVQLLSQGLGYSFYGRFFDCVKNGTLMGPGAGISTGRGLFLDLCTHGHFEDLVIQGFRYGRTMWEVQYSTFKAVRCVYNQVGTYATARPSDTTLTSIDNKHENCSDVFNTYYGVWAQCDSMSSYTRHDSSRNGVCDVLIGGQLTGQLRTFTVTSGGSGYPTNAVIAATITDGSGTMAQAYAETNGSGVVTGVFSVDAGSGYVAPTVTIPGGGVAAVIACTPVSDTALGDWIGSSATNRGRNVFELKVEHADADRPSSGYAVIVNGSGHRQNRFPNLCVQRQGVTNKAYYRWLFNAGRGTVVEFPGDPSNQPSSLARPGAATDYSIVRSTTFGGLTMLWGGFMDGDKILRYGVDAAGAVDYSANVLHLGFASTGEVLSTWYMAESSFGQGVVYKGRVTGDANSRLEIGVDGTIKVGAGSSAPAVKARLTTVGVSADRGDASVTVVAGTDDQTQRFATALTANRIVTLSGTGAVKGDRFRVVRTGLGAGTLDVGGLKTIPAATAGWVDTEHDGTAWRLTGYGLL